MKLDHNPYNKSSLPTLTFFWLTTLQVAAILVAMAPKILEVAT